MKHLAGKRVLLIAPDFFGYDIAIRDELVHRGASVESLVDRPFSSPLLKAATTHARSLLMPLTDAHYRRELDALSGAAFDIVLVIVGQTVGPRLLTFLRTSHPGARFILYLWDSLENRRSVLQNLPHFDAVSSFDPDDCTHYGLRYRPLFFSGNAVDFSGSRGDLPYGLSFVGTIHSDRYSVVNRVAAALPPDVRFYKYLYLQAPWVLHAHRVMQPKMRRARRSEFAFKPLSKQQIAGIFRDSFAVLDIEHPRQRGLTMRTFEAIGACKKLVTTNTVIRRHDFFDENNFLVIDREFPSFPLEFLNSPVVSMSPERRYRYSIAGWLDDLLSLGSDDPRLSANWDQRPKN